MCVCVRARVCVHMRVFSVGLKSPSARFSSLNSNDWFHLFKKYVFPSRWKVNVFPFCSFEDAHGWSDVFFSVSIYGIWFYDKEECQRIAELMKK